MIAVFALNADEVVPFTRSLKSLHACNPGKQTLL